jgi:predicted esterase
MPTTLISLHGFTMNGAGLRHMLSELEPRLSDLLDFEYPDAPHPASEASVAGIASLMGGFRPKPPNRQWWNASDDGFTYHGWDKTRDLLRTTAVRSVTAEPHTSQTRGVALLGFSQGAAVAAALAALSRRGEFPPLRFIVLVAGFAPRAHDIEPLFDTPLEVPSLHVWGDADPFAKHGPKLLERFAPHTRQVLEWAGRHTIPTIGSTADSIVEFMRQHA